MNRKNPPSRQAHVFCSLTITDVRFVLVFNADKFCSPATGSSVLKDNADPLLTPQGRETFKVHSICWITIFQYSAAASETGFAVLSTLTLFLFLFFRFGVSSSNSSSS